MRENDHTLILVYCVDDPLASDTLQSLIHSASELPLVFIVENISDEQELALYRHGARYVFRAQNDPNDLLGVFPVNIILDSGLGWNLNDCSGSTWRAELLLEHHAFSMI